MILFDEFVKLQVSPEFWEMFLVVIQLGAIMAVLILYFKKLNPFSSRKSEKERHATFTLWGKVLVGCIPAAIIGFLLDDWVEEHFFNAVIVACALIIYGIAFILIERIKGQEELARTMRQARSRVTPTRHERMAMAFRNTQTPEDELASLSFGRALMIGFFQCLAIIPGTSRSGSTILGGLILGVSRQVAAEFSFFLAIPVMFGWSLLKVFKGFVLEKLVLTTTEWGVLAVGIVTAFIVSIIAIRFLMGYIRNHSFAVFGWYRIIFGVLVLAFFAITGTLFTIGA
jgi:undecaprenyl-diphosphatase